MHEQNFEKQVQQKLEELSLTPSAPVWQKVEEQIRKKKDRRRLIFWLLPLLLAGGSAWWLLSGSHDRVATSDTVSTTKQHPVPPTTPPGTAPDGNTISAAEEKTQNTAPGSDKLTTRSTTLKNYYQTTRTPQPKLPAAPLTAKLEAATREKEAPASINETVKSDQAEVTQTRQSEKGPDKKEEAVSRQEATIGEEATDVLATVADATTSPERDTVAGSSGVINPIPTVATPAAKADSAALAPAAPRQQLTIKEWQWTVHAEAGVTSVLAALFQLPATRSYDAFSSPAQYSGGNFYAYYPSPQEAGPAFSAGGAVKRLLRNRLRLTAGLQYNYYSTKMAVGQEKRATATSAVPFARQSVTADNAYLPGVQNDYSNRYHFVQLPIGVEYQVFRNLPLQVHGGVIVAHLVNTNALTYDYQAQAYYQNRSVYNATQMHLFTNLSYSIWKGTGKKLEVGPYVQYSLTELQKTAPDKNRLFSTGLRTQFSF